MAQTYVRLRDDAGVALQDDAGVFLLAYGESAQDLVGGSGGQKGKGQFDNRLWEIYQLEVEQRFRPKPKPKEPEPQPEPKQEFQPAPPSGFFDAPMNPEEMFQRVRAAAEAKERQRALNSKTISDLLRKARR